MQAVNTVYRMNVSCVYTNRSGNEFMTLVDEEESKVLGKETWVTAKLNTRL